MLNIILDYLNSSLATIQNFEISQLIKLIPTLLAALSIIPSDINWPKDYGISAIEQGTRYYC